MKHTHYNPIYKLQRYKWLIALCLAGFTSLACAFDGNFAVFGDGDGNIYRLNKTGTLFWLPHSNRQIGAPISTTLKPIDVTPGSSMKKFFTNVDKIFPGSDGVIYIINNQGQLIWTRHDGRFNGSKVWGKQNTATILARGWNQFERVFSGGDGIIYAIAPDGKMHWYHHKGWLDGSKVWAQGSGRVVGRGWQGTSQVFSGDNGVIYSIMPSGSVRWHLHKGRFTGEEDWANNGFHSLIGLNWHTRHAFSSGDGVIYATTNTGNLNWYRHTEWFSGKEGWAPRSGQAVYTGFVDRQ